MSVCMWVAPVWVTKIYAVFSNFVLIAVIFSYSNAENDNSLLYNRNTSIFSDDFINFKTHVDETRELMRIKRSPNWQDQQEKRNLHLLSRTLIPDQLNTFRSAPMMTGSVMAMDPYENYWGSDGNTQMWQGPLGSYGSLQPFNGQQQAIYSPQASLSAMGGYGLTATGPGSSPYAGYLEKQIASYPVMIYTLNDCIPCQRAKQLLAMSYPDVRAHFLELSGNQPWQQQLQIDLQYLTGAITFPYIFVCGQYIGGSSDLFELHESGQLRRMISQCLKTAIPKN